MLLVIMCIALIIYDRKKFLGLIKLAGQKEHQLKDIISDAELMIDELNNLSDYIINQIEKRNLEFKESIESYRSEINNVNQKKEELLEILNNVCSSSEATKDEVMSKNETYNGGKFSMLNNKYREVVRLFNEGVEETEIARQLNIGKGEVQLILQFIKQKNL